MGLLDLAKGALNPNKPLSLEHWLSSLGLASALYGMYEAVKQAIALRKDNTISGGRVDADRDDTPLEGGGGAAPGTSKLIGKEEGELFGKYASKATPIDGYTDVIVHGAPPSKVAVMHNGEWVYLDHRSLANFLRQDAGYTRGPIRILSCGTGSSPTGYAQNLANKMGVEVIAPSDTIWAFPNGRLTIGPD